MDDPLDNLRKLAELRTRLEIFAVRELAGGRPADMPLAQALKDLIGEAAAAARRHDHARFGELDHRLHETLVKASGVPLLPELWAQVWRALADFHTASLSKHWPDLRVLAQEHEYLAHSVLSGDTMAAEDGVRSHLQAVWYRIAEKRGDFPKNEDPLERATAYLCFHYHRRVSLAQVARRVAFVTPGHLSKLFRRRYGASFQGYLQNLRLTQAAELLRHSNQPIRVVAARCGYRDVSRFGQHFRRAHGMTPLRWREANADGAQNPREPRRDFFPARETAARSAKRPVIPVKKHRRPKAG